MSSDDLTDGSLALVPVTDEGEGMSLGDLTAMAASAAIVGDEAAADTGRWLREWAADPTHPITLWLRNAPRVNTRLAYRDTAATFAAWLGRSPLEATFEDLLEYREWLEALGRQPANPMARLSSLYSFLEKRGVVVPNPFVGLNVPTRHDERAKRAWELSEIHAFYAAIPRDGKPIHLRDRALFHLMFANGLREGELLGANLGDLTTKFGRPVLEVTDHGTAEYVKGGHSRDAVLKPDTYAAIMAYLEARGLKAGAEVHSDPSDATGGDWRALPLFMSTRKGVGRPFTDSPRSMLLAGPRAREQQLRAREEGRLSPETIAARMRVYAQVAGIDPELVHPHAARHTFTTWLVRLNTPLNEVMVATGHRQLATVQRYLDMHVHVSNNAALKIPY